MICVAIGDDFAQRKFATETVLRWIEEYQGREVMTTWAWECTPIPCGLPDDEQLAEGVGIALGEVKIGDVLARVYRSMSELAAAELHCGDEKEGGSP